ncbi:MAG: response regulator [Balneolaceae bacterium]|nr:response regulator [Balneolaceae bacterium]
MNRSILIVDDDQTIREALSIFLTGEGYTCHLAKDGREALEKLCSVPVDLILLDLHMSRQQGLNVLDQIMESSPDITVIIITAYYHIDEAAKALKKGASRLVLKPIDFEELLSVVNEHFQD